MMKFGSTLVAITAFRLKRAASTLEASSSLVSSLNTEHFFINGTWTKPAKSSNPTSLPVIDPSTGSIITLISLADEQDVDAAVSAAKGAFDSWAYDTTPSQRRQYVERLLSIYSERYDEMGQIISLEMGAPIDMAHESQAGAGLYHIESSLRALEHFEFEKLVPGDDPEDPSTIIVMDPVGVVVMITPWNWPMNQVTLKVVPALLVGCTCVLKPSELAPLSSLLFAEMMQEAQFPPGVFNLVNGDGAGAGTLLTKHRHVDMVSFTGSTRAGALISKNAADSFKRVKLELGGKGANIIFADVDNVQETVADGVYHCFGNSGQSCNSPTRMLVERSIYDLAVETAQETAEEVQVDSAHEHGSHIGPVVSRAQYEKIQKLIQKGIDEGARLVSGGLGRPEGTNPEGYYVRPTVFADCNSTMTIMQEEFFGPVLCIAPFDSDEEALAIANDVNYGLTNYVYTTDGGRLNRFARRLRSGMVEMNGMGGADGAPFGGMKASGNAREGGVWGLEEFCEVKAVSGWDFYEHVEEDSVSDEL